MQNIRNARHNSNGTIDVELEHPDLGWIPFTASADDPSGAEIYAQAASGTVAPIDPDRAFADRLASYKTAFDSHLDGVARQRQYDDRLSIAAYVASTNPQWAAEAQAFVAWRDQALLYMFAQLAAVQAGEIAPPTIEMFIAGIPPIAWPAA